MTPESFRPEGIRIGKEGITPTTNGRGKTPGTAVVEAKQAMMDRGIVNPDELLQFATPARILAACRWFDGQRSAGPGVLAKTIRSGGVDDSAARRRQSGLEEQKQYGLAVVAWLRRHFPEFNQGDDGTHPAAIVEVIHLHSRHGRGSLTVGEHGEAIRAAVARSDEREAA